MHSSRGLDLGKWSVLILVPIILWGFYWYIGFDQTIVKYMLFITAVLLLLFNLSPLFKAFSKKKSYERIVAIIVGLIVFSFLMAWLYWGQNPVLTFRAAAAQFSILYFFLLKRYKVDFDNLNTIITIFAIIYVVLWFFALAAAPMVLFGNLDEIQDDRGFFRILQLNSIDTLCLFYFLCLVRFGDKKNSNRILWIILAIASYIIVFLSLSRNLIFSISIVTVVYLLIYNRKSFVVFAIVLGLGGYGLISSNEIVSSLFSMTEEQIEEKSEGNLRLVEYTQFTKLYPFHVGTVLFGNGEPHVASSYGVREERLKDNLGFNRSDAGYVHVIVSYGLVMLVVFISLFIKVIKQKVEKEHLYYKLFIYMILIVNVLASVFFSYMISFVICLYALELERNRQFHYNRITALEEQ